MSASSGTGSLIAPKDMPFLQDIVRLSATSPFDPAWAACVGAVLRDGCPLSRDDLEGAQGGFGSKRFQRAVDTIPMVLAASAMSLRNGAVGTAEEREVYRRAATFALFGGFGAKLQQIIDDNAVDVPFEDEFLEVYRFMFPRPGLAPEPGHMLALFYQARRNWYFAATKLRGMSPSAQAARWAVWRACRGNDADLYADELYVHMPSIPVLITGETGTGKDLAATCVAFSRYIPFDAGGHRFVQRYADDFYVKNLAEIPGDLIPSALFGYRKGSFTGAIADTPGFFGLVKEYGTLFLDEVGILPLSVQAQLLRPFQNREYVPLGENRPRPIVGRLVFATNGDLEAMVRANKFYADLLERMNGARIHMPTLRQMISESPDELRHYIRVSVATKIKNPERIEILTDKVLRSIHENPQALDWSRNLRALHQCTMRGILDDDGRPAPEKKAPALPKVEEEATSPPPTAATAPMSLCAPSSSEMLLGPKAKAGEVNLPELESAFLSYIFVKNDQNLAKTAEITGVDPRTVKKKLDWERIKRWLARKKE